MSSAASPGEIRPGSLKSGSLRSPGTVPEILSRVSEQGSGEGGIRTQEAENRPRGFQPRSLSHSDTSPGTDKGNAAWPLAGKRSRLGFDSQGSTPKGAI